jgi:hypothetical protein
VLLGELDRLLGRVRGGAPLGRGRRALGGCLDRGQLLLAAGDERDPAAELDLVAGAAQLPEKPLTGRLDLDRGLGRLDDADRLALPDLSAVLDQPLDQDRRLAVRVFAREDDLEQSGCP